MNFGEVGLGGHTCHLQDPLQLIQRRRAWKQRLSIVDLGKYASEAPNVYLEGVLGRSEQDLRSSVPSRRNIIGQNRINERFDAANPTCQSKVTEPNLAGLVYQQVCRLQIPMDDLSRVNVLESTQNLPRYEAHLNVSTAASADHRVQIGLHELKNDVNVNLVRGLPQVLDLDNVLVRRHFQIEIDLAEGALGVGVVGKGVVNLLDCDRLFTLLLNGFPDNAIGASADALHRFVLLQNDLVDLLYF